VDVVVQNVLPRDRRRHHIKASRRAGEQAVTVCYHWRQIAKMICIVQWNTVTAKICYVQNADR